MSESEPAIPPEAVRSSIEKSIGYILKNGADFEQKLIQNDPKGLFSFLIPTDKFHLYYQAALSERKAANGRPESGKLGPEAGMIEPETGKPSIRKPRDPLFQTSIPPLNTHDLQVLKSVALYVACNSDKHGELFYKYMERKGRKGQFSFIRKHHSLHSLYQLYIRQYRAVIDQETNRTTKDTGKIADLVENSGDLYFNKSYDRAAYEKANKTERRNREAELKQRQTHYASIDWQDFVPIARVNFDAVDQVSELPAPFLREKVAARSLASRSTQLKPETKEKVGEQETREKESEKEPKGKEKANETKGKEVATPQKIPGMKIKAAGESRLKRKAKEQSEGTLLCPFTGENIPESQFDTHLRELLRDPRYKEQQENYMRKNSSYSSNLTTDQVYENIKNLVRRTATSEEEQEHIDKRRKGI